MSGQATGSNRRFRDPWFALQVAAFRRAPVQIKRIEKGDLVRLRRQATAGHTVLLEALVRTKVLDDCLGVGSNRRFRDPFFALQVAGFRRFAVPIQGLEKEDLVSL